MSPKAPSPPDPDPAPLSERLSQALYFAVYGLVLALLLGEGAARWLAPKPQPSALDRVSHIQPDKFDEMIAVLATPKPKREFRIVVTGGSAAAGHGASVSSATFPAQLERLLNQSAGARPIRVFNGGVLGMDAPGELMLYTRFLQKLQPDMVVMFTGFNDLWDAVKYQTSHRPYQHVQDLQRFTFVPPSEPPRYLALFLRASVLSLHQGMQRGSRLYDLLAQDVRRWDAFPMRNLTAFRYEDAVRDVKPFVDSVHALHALSSRDGFELVVVIQPVRSFSTLPMSEAPISRWEAKVRLLYRDYFLPELRKLVHADGLAFLDLNEAGVTNRLVRENHFLPLDFCHLTDGGYRLSAETAAAFLLKRSAALAKLRASR